MNSETTGLVRRHILVQLAGAGVVGMSEELILQETRRRAARESTPEDIASTLASLQSAGLALSFQSVLGAKRWRATALGESALREEGLA